MEGGDSFSEALQKHPKVFTRLYVCMVAAGEKGGLLAEILARVATYLENTARLRKKVKSAMMYPTVVTVVVGKPLTITKTTEFRCPPLTRSVVRRYCHPDFHENPVDAALVG